MVEDGLPSLSGVLCVLFCHCCDSSQYRKDSVTLCHEGFSDAIELTECHDLLMTEKGDRNEEVLDEVFFSTSVSPPRSLKHFVGSFCLLIVLQSYFFCKKHFCFNNEIF